VIQIADEEPKPGDFTPIDFSAVSVEQNAELDKEGQGGPLVFLNACQGGRAGVQLGSLGGFAQAFLCGGAGAFVSTLWSVGDNIARTFGEEFYKRLIAGETVSTAVRRAREAGARTPDGQRPDVSWLAYVVYANPNATLEKP
jgi:CHAT domain-containing protein